MKTILDASDLNVKKNTAMHALLVKRAKQHSAQHMTLKLWLLPVPLALAQ
jgi:ADP-ribose pyrophosphatase YjhB (NUDIX family)